jgi:hypothetical protein
VALVRCPVIRTLPARVLFALVLISTISSSTFALASVPGRPAPVAAVPVEPPGVLSPLAPPITILIVDAPALPPEFALRAEADTVPTLDASDVRAGLPYTPPLRLEELLPSRFDVINLDPFRYAVVAIVVALPENPGAGTSSRFDGKYWLTFVGWGLLQIADMITTFDAVAKCPMCRELNVLAREGNTEHPGFVPLSGLKLSAAGASLWAEARGNENVADGVLYGGIAGGILAIVVNTTSGKNGAKE